MALIDARFVGAQVAHVLDKREPTAMTGDLWPEARVKQLDGRGALAVPCSKIDVERFQRVGIGGRA